GLTALLPRALLGLFNSALLFGAVSLLTTTGLLGSAGFLRAAALSRAPTAAAGTAFPRRGGGADLDLGARREAGLAVDDHALAAREPFGHDGLVALRALHRDAAVV